MMMGRPMMKFGDDVSEVAQPGRHVHIGRGYSLLPLTASKSRGARALRDPLAPTKRLEAVNSYSLSDSPLCGRHPISATARNHTVPPQDVVPTSFPCRLNLLPRRARVNGIQPPPRGVYCDSKDPSA